MSKFQKGDWVIPEEKPTISDFDRIRLETALKYHTEGGYPEFNEALWAADEAIRTVLSQPFKRTE